MGYTYIVAQLNEKGYRTKRGLAFTKTSLYDILSNEKYTGIYIYNKESSKSVMGKRNKRKHKPDDQIIRVDGGMPQIVTREDWEKVQKLMSSRKKLNGSHKSKRIYLLSGLIACGECNHSYTGMNTRWCGPQKIDYGSYTCSRRKSLKDCDNSEISLAALEDFVLQELECYIFDPRRIDILVRKIN